MKKYIARKAHRKTENIDTTFMSQHHNQHGTFHITTNAHKKIPWCTVGKVPEIIIDNLVVTRNIYGAGLHAFCILPNHVHLIVSTGEKGLSTLMQSLKSNITKDVHQYLKRNLDIFHQLGRGVPVTGKLGCGIPTTGELGHHVPGTGKLGCGIPITGELGHHVPGTRKLGCGIPTTGDVSTTESVDNNINVIRWQNGFFDKRIRNTRQLSTIFGYVEGNAMKHGLVREQSDWPWTSIHFPHVLDPMEMWLDG